MLLFEQLAIITVLAVVLGLIMDRLKQPALLGYILAGVMMTGFGWLHYQSEELIVTFGELGVTLLLFLVGMEVSWPKLRALGWTALVIGIGQISVTFAGGLMLARFLGFGSVEAAFLAIALTFSSTIIVIKLLGEKNDLQSLHGRISVGILLVQDFAAIVLLVVLTGLRAGDLDWTLALELLIKFAMLVGSVWVMSKYVVPWGVSKVSHSTELLFLSALAWGIGLAAFLSWDVIGFSTEVGGFVAGITLANAIEQRQILVRLRPLRDFFIMLFFVSLGSSLVLRGFDDLWLMVVIFSVFVFVGNPLIVLVLMWALKYRLRTGFMTSLTMAQISEFSLIVMLLGHKLGYVGDQVLGVVTLVGVVTMTGSTYLISRSDRIWRRLEPALKRFERHGSHDLRSQDGHVRADHVVLLGCHRTGRSIWRQLKKQGEQVVIVDFDPDIVKNLMNEGADVIYGDMSDVEHLAHVNLDRAKMVISTIVDHQDTSLLLEYLNSHPHRKSLLVMVTGEYAAEALQFYKLGADYVAVPRWMTGVHVGEMLAQAMKKDDFSLVKKEAKWEMEEMMEQVKLGVAAVSAG